jgi:polyhydroxybutyrate depolymerase
VNTRTVIASAITFVCAVTACSAGGDDRATPRSTTGASAATPTTRPRPTRSKGCDAPAPVPAGTSDHRIEVGGTSRVYELDVPKSYDGTKPYAVVFGLHALTVSYKFVPSMVGFDLAARYHFIGVAPSGRLNGSTPYWFAAPTADNYDVDFIGRLLDALESKLCIDPSRVFSTGMSNGAQMSSLLACRMSSRITAIAPVAGEEFLAPCGGSPVPIIAFHGSADPILPYGGGGLNATTIAAQDYWKGPVPADMPTPLGIDDSMARWAKHNGCTAKFAEVRVTTHVRRRTWEHCTAPTILYVVDGGGHAWPGQRFPQFEAQFGPGTTEIDATTLIYHFFFGK